MTESAEETESFYFLVQFHSPTLLHINTHSRRFTRALEEKQKKKNLIVDHNRTWVPITTRSKSRTWLGMRKRASSTIRFRAGTASKYRASNSRTTRTSRRVPVAVS